MLGLTILGLATSPSPGQGIDLLGRPVGEIQVQGLISVPEQLVHNQVRLRPGSPYDARVVQEDIVRITHLGRFKNVQAQVQPQPDGSVVVIYVLTEQPLLTAVTVQGNKAIPTEDLLGMVGLLPGDPAFGHLIDRGIHQIQSAYEKAGFFSTSVTYDQQLLDEKGELVFKVREGPKIRIRQMTFQGIAAFTTKQLRSKIKSTTYIPILRPGVLNRQELDNDAARIREFYNQRGYLDAQVGRKIDLSPDQKDAAVTFLVDEGRLYTVSAIRVEGNTIFNTTQVIEAMPLKVGDVFTTHLLDSSQRALRDLYGTLGYIQAGVQIDRLFHDKLPQVELLVRVREGRPYLVGTVSVRGNQLTQDKVIMRSIRGLGQGRRFDSAGMRATEQMLKQSSLFSDAKITILGDPEDAYRDVLIEVKEANTGSLSFGAGISSDAGIVGAIDLIQRNFDVADPPESPGEFFTGKSFRGAGQYFSLSLQPGDELSRYAVSFREPYLLDMDVSLDTSLFFFERQREDWDEQRSGGSFGLGRRFGDVWSASIRFRAEEIEISNINTDAPIDAFQVQGDSLITSIGVVVGRNTTDNRIFPTRGNRIQLELTRTGALGGDFDFTRVNLEFNQFWTLDEDFFGRRTVLSARVEVGHIVEQDEAPLFERLYAGGHRDFRGFRFRGVGPRGIRNDTRTVGDDPVGGDWLLLFGLQYDFPVFQDVVRGVLFLDTGTVQDDLGFEEYRVSAGAGIRLKIPFLGQAPFALDFAVPIVKEPNDETQVVSFDLALPF